MKANSKFIIIHVFLLLIFEAKYYTSTSIATNFYRSSNSHY